VVLAYLNFVLIFNVYQFFILASNNGKGLLKSDWIFHSNTCIRFRHFVVKINQKGNKHNDELYIVLKIIPLVKSHQEYDYCLSKDGLLFPLKLMEIAMSMSIMLMSIMLMSIMLMSIIGKNRKVLSVLGFDIQWWCHIHTLLHPICLLTTPFQFDILMFIFLTPFKIKMILHRQKGTWAPKKLCFQR